ncbi:MAG: hypothetical protein JOZ69_15405, partial [Myxococcales bacterium]|nr:hypothetical protein [Myxococcales bacterium]
GVEDAALATFPLEFRQGMAARAEVLGDVDAAREDWHFEGPFQRMTFAARNQHRIYWGPLKKPLEWSLKTWLAPWAYVASVVYHDMFWYERYGRERIRGALASDWGRLFANWGRVSADAEGRGYPDVGAAEPALARAGIAHFLEGLRLVGMAVMESPEVKRRRHRRARPEAATAHVPPGLTD